MSTPNLELRPDAPTPEACSACTVDGWCAYHVGYFRGVSDGWDALAEVIRWETGDDR
ncbi:hypothetical protein [Actinoalloteichus hymeniacidonis]|uniref:Uncharacterized protein n=1 Tax=Actinoalloteichus hymeniacidonis TaxID=340345 RepID=A0AAC9HU86_9PSEU|nr:hypothetical protein [Actinoalloteichus hymeniacidonis]AOS65001.1 hypothetical protein TL08_21055 [Actinoalloteichus hymeniacidonis]MBB5906922.1 hypothetical protein [Actinoalloteichus hymeniacidonis]